MRSKRNYGGVYFIMILSALVYIGIPILITCILIKVYKLLFTKHIKIFVGKHKDYQNFDFDEYFDEWFSEQNYETIEKSYNYTYDFDIIYYHYNKKYHVHHKVSRYDLLDELFIPEKHDFYHMYDVCPKSIVL